MPVEASAPLTGKSMPIRMTLSALVCVVDEADAPAVASLCEVDVELFDEHPAVTINPNPSTNSPEYTPRKRIASLQSTVRMGYGEGAAFPFPYECAVTRWTQIAGFAAILFFALAINNDVYALTSPYQLEWHLVLRKTYSIVAFAIVGYCVRRAFDDHRRTRAVWLNVAALAAYSALIELVQAIGGSHEGLAWNAVDVACGAVGGFIGDRVVRWRDRSHEVD
jgi:hypothetical protein